MFHIDGVGGASGDGASIGNCPNPSNPTDLVPSELKCFNSGICHRCITGNVITLDVFADPHYPRPSGDISNGCVPDTTTSGSMRVCQADSTGNNECQDCSKLSPSI